MEMCSKCGKEAKSFFKAGAVGNEVWFKCNRCETEWQDHCRVCGNPLEIRCSQDDAFATCIICGGQ